MAVWHGESGKKKTGGLIKLSRKKRKHELGSIPLEPKMEKEKKHVVKTKGGGRKIKFTAIEFVNVLNPADKTVKKVKILDVLENTANPHFVRRKLITKGAVVKTEIGNAKITSRPNQDGVVNAIALTTEEKKR